MDGLTHTKQLLNLLSIVYIITKDTLGMTKESLGMTKEPLDITNEPL